MTSEHEFDALSGACVRCQRTRGAVAVSGAGCDGPAAVAASSLPDPHPGRSLSAADVVDLYARAGGGGAPPAGPPSHPLGGGLVARGRVYDWVDRPALTYSDCTTPPPYEPATPAAVPGGRPPPFESRGHMIRRVLVPSLDVSRPPTHSMWCSGCGMTLRSIVEKDAPGCVRLPHPPGFRYYRGSVRKPGVAVGVTACQAVELATTPLDPGGPTLPRPHEVATGRRSQLSHPAPAAVAAGYYVSFTLDELPADLRALGEAGVMDRVRGGRLVLRRLAGPGTPLVVDRPAARLKMLEVLPLAPEFADAARGLRVRDLFMAHPAVREFADLIGATADVWSLCGRVAESERLFDTTPPAPGE